MTRFIATLPGWLVYGVLVLSFFSSSFIYYGVVLSGTLYFVWIYTLVVESGTLRGNSSMTKYKAALVYCVAYLLVASRYLLDIMPYAIPFHLFAMYCIFYSMYRAAKMMKSVELGRDAKFEEFFAIFCCIWVFPFGGWYVQNKMRKLVINASEPPMAKSPQTPPPA